MSSDENKIIFNEIKSYEDAYYHNSDPNDRLKYKNNEIKLEKKRSDLLGKLLGLIGEIAEGILEIIFSFLD